MLKGVLTEMLAKILLLYPVTIRSKGPKARQRCWPERQEIQMSSGINRQQSLPECSARTDVRLH